MLRIADLAAIGSARDGRRALLAIDSTLATPMIQQPLALGADVVIHSATKAIGGHSDLLLGAVVTADPAVLGELRTHRTLHGAVPGALEAFLATRGARTLPLRFERAQDNALRLAVRLEAHSMVSTVHHPGLRTHPDHARAAGQMRGFGSMVSFELHGDARQADAVCAQLRLIVHATSLGGVESTIERRAAVPGQQHLPPSLLRLSVGCEHVDDLWTDLAAALDGAARTRPAQSAD
jgi:cystathionine gamma-synthase